MGVGPDVVRKGEEPFGKHKTFETIVDFVFQKLFMFSLQSQYGVQGNIKLAAVGSFLRLDGKQHDSVYTWLRPDEADDKLLK